MRGLVKSYAAPVLKGLNFGLRPGEVVALTGENGAGKSTAAKIIAGILRPDEGAMTLAGTSYAPADRRTAERAGVRMVMQELVLLPTLSIAENLLLGEMPARGGFLDRAKLERLARDKLARVGLADIDPHRPVGVLGIGQQQLIEIARGLAADTRVLVLDEPTAMLTPGETARLFAQIERLSAAGVGVIYISHRLDELKRITNRIDVLRDGALVATWPTREARHDEIVRAMVGRDPAASSRRHTRTAGTERLRTVGLSRSPGVHDVNLALHSGEILGLAGLVGSGRTELLRLIFGADRPDSGDIRLGGASAPTRIRSPQEAVALGIGFLTEDRKSQGLLQQLPVATNLTLADLGSVSRLGWIRPTLERMAAEHWSRVLTIRLRDGSQAVDELSGGNQQKVVLARWLHRDCRVLLLDEPTRGIDVAAREDIYRELDALAAAGKALLMVSSDLRELMDCCDRILVMSEGRLVAEFQRGNWTESGILAAAFSAYDRLETGT